MDADDPGLTSRELEVLRLVAAGQSNREIAAALVISPKTASVHVSNILAKLGAATRTEAAVKAHELFCCITRPDRPASGRVRRQPLLTDWISRTATWYGGEVLAARPAAPGTGLQLGRRAARPWPGHAPSTRPR